MKPALPTAGLPAPVRPIAGLVLLGCSLGFTGLLSIIHVIVRLFD